MTKELDRCQELFSDLLRKTQHGAVPTGPCIAAAEAGAYLLSDIANSNRLLDDCRQERNTLQKICAERAAKIERLRAALKPFSELAHVVLAEAPTDAGYVSLFVDSAGRSHRITLDQLRAAADHQQSPNQEQK